MEKKPEMLVTPFANASKQKAMSHMNTFGRGAGGQATSVAAPIQALIHRFDKNRSRMHNMGVVGSAP